MGYLFLFYHNVGVLTNFQVSLSFGVTVDSVKLFMFSF